MKMNNEDLRMNTKEILTKLDLIYKVREDNQPPGPCGFSGKYKVYKCLESLSFLSHFTNQCDNNYY